MRMSAAQVATALAPAGYGQRYGSWTVEGPAETDAYGSAQWHCRCQCGTRKVVRDANLRLGLSHGCKNCAAARRKKGASAAGFTPLPAESIRTIQLEAARAFGVTLSDVLGRSLIPDNVRARFAAVWISHRMTGVLAHVLAQAFCRLNTQSISYARSHAEWLVSSDREFAARVLDVIRAVKADHSARNRRDGAE